MMLTVGRWQWDVAITRRLQCCVAGVSSEWQRSCVQYRQPSAILGMGALRALSRESDHSRVWEDKVIKTWFMSLMLI